MSDEVLRKIGRNVLLFQQIEGLLKLLVANHRFVSSTKTSCVKHQQKRTEQVQKQMLGKLVEQYTDGILSDAGAPLKEKEPEDVTQAWISSTFKIAVNSDLYESYRADLELMVGERNDLIHHFLPRWQPDSLEHMTAAESYLDQQREKVLPIIEHLKSVTNSMQEAKTKLAVFLASDEFKHHFKLVLLQDSPLVALLLEVATQKARPDGWTYIAHAGQLAREYEADEVTHMKERYGHSTLKQLLIAAELFDVRDEPLSNGGFRTLYRLKEMLEH